VVPVDGSLLQLLDRYGFEPDATRTRWHFDGHPSQACSVDLTVEDSAEGVVYKLAIAEFPGGMGYEEELRYSAAERPRLERDIERHCEAALKPYVKTRLQRFFEPFLGHDMAYALFHRPPKER
jgi:hypothetical protein